MKPIHRKLRELAAPYLDTRHNDVHTDSSVEFAYKLLEMEGGDEDIVIPAVILHDVGWKMVSEDMQLKAFGPNAIYPDLNRVHEVEGAKIAEEILRAAGYEDGRIPEIVEIIEGHDSRLEPLSLNDKIVKDSDKLYRYTNDAFHTNMKRFGHSADKYLERLRIHLSIWLNTDSGKKMAREELRDREQEVKALLFKAG